MISSLATGLTLAPNEIFAWLTVEVKVLMLLCAAGLALGATGCDSSGNGVPGQGVNTAPAGTYSLTITARNSVGSVTQAFTLAVS